MRLFGRRGWLARGKGLRRLGGGLARSWVEMLRGLGQGFLDLLGAEWEQLKAELAVSAKRLGLGVGLLAAAGMLCFWLLGTLVYFAIQLLAIWLALWAAAGLVALALLVVIAVVALVGLHTLKRIENPIETVGRRWDDHLDWWEARLVREDLAAAGAADEAGGTDDGDDGDGEEAR